MAANNTKKIVFAVIGAVALALLGYYLYRTWGPRLGARAPSSDSTGSGSVGSLRTPIPGIGTSGSPLPAPGEGITTGGAQGITVYRLTDFPVIAPALNKKEDKIVFYQKNGGNMYESDFTGTGLQKISNFTIVGLFEALWSPSRDRSILFYLSEDDVKSFLIVGTSSVTSLPMNIKSLSWSPDGKEFAYFIDDQNPAGAALAISPAQGTRPRIVGHIPVFDAQLQWVSADIMAIQTAPSGLAPGSLFAYSRSSGALRRIAGSRNGLTSLWSPAGTRVWTTFTNNKGHDLANEIYSRAGKKERAGGKVPVLPGKCAWIDTNDMFCGLPKSVPNNAILPDDYLRGDLWTLDRLALFNLKTNETTYILEDTNFDISNVVVTKKKDFLFFINKIDGTLWSVKLK